MLDGVYRTTEGLPVFHTVHAPTAAELEALLNRIIKRMQFLTRKGYLIEEQGTTNDEPWKVEDRGEKPAIALKGR